MGGISIWQLLIVLVIVLVLFGAKRLRNIGADLGASIKGFRNAMKEGEQPESEEEDKKQIEHESQARVIDAETTRDSTTVQEDNFSKEKSKV